MSVNSMFSEPLGKRRCLFTIPFFGCPSTTADCPGALADESAYAGSRTEFQWGGAWDCRLASGKWNRGTGCACEKPTMRPSVKYGVHTMCLQHPIPPRMLSAMSFVLTKTLIAIFSFQSRLTIVH